MKSRFCSVRSTAVISALFVAAACGGSEQGSGLNGNGANGSNGSTNSGANGTFVSGVDDVGGFNVDNTATRDGDTCIQLDVQVERLTPSLMLLLDRSGSMDQPFGQMDRWSTLRDILVNPTTGVIPAFASEIQFGIATYTSLNGVLGPDEDNPVTNYECPIIQNLPVGQANLMTAEAFLPFSDTIEGTEDTPTAESITATAQLLLTQATVPGPRAIILATDGEPDTCADPDANNAASQALSVQAVQAAFQQGVQTYVISVGDQVAAPHLQDLANAGQGVDQGAEYYEALDAQALADAFNKIIYGVVPCEFTLNGTVVPGGEAQGSVVIGGTPAVLNDPNGWSLTSPNSVALNGTSCDAAKNGALIAINFPCDLFIIK